MTKLSFCQQGYPKKLIIEGDTICGITMSQLDSINSIIVNLDECNELKDSIYSQVKVCGDLVNAQKEIISSQDKEIKIQKDIVIEKDKIINIDDTVKKRLERRVKWLKIQRAILTLLAVGLGGALIL